MQHTLFNSSQGPVTGADFKRALLNVGAAECDVLYIHTDMTFGLPALPRKSLLSELLDLILNLDVKTLIFPLFTFSFCNGEIYDPFTSKSQMGAINEFARKSGLGFRTLDPLLSVYVIGDPLNLALPPGKESIGKDSSYDRLHKSGKDIKFLFFGADMSACFTYTHYMEAILNVPYRYPREFQGEIFLDGKLTPCTAILHSTYANCRLNPEPVTHNTMLAANQLHKCAVGDNGLCCFSERDAFNSLSAMIENNPLCLTDGSFDPSAKITTYNPSGQRVVSVL